MATCKFVIFRNRLFLKFNPPDSHFGCIAHFWVQTRLTLEVFSRCFHSCVLSLCRISPRKRQQQLFFSLFLFLQKEVALDAEECLFRFSVFSQYLDFSRKYRNSKNPHSQSLKLKTTFRSERLELRQYLNGGKFLNMSIMPYLEQRWRCLFISRSFLAVQCLWIDERV